MSANPLPSVQSGAAPMSELSRLVGVFFEPKKTFADIAQRPRWFVPFLISVLFSVGFLYAFSTHIGWEPYLHRILDTNARMQQLPAEQRQNIFTLYSKIIPVFGYIAAILFVPIMYLAGSGIAVGIIKGLMGVPIRFKQAFAAFAYGALPNIIYNALSTVVVFVTRNPEDFNPQNGFVSNPAALMDPQTTSKFLYTEARYLDVFVIWLLLLIATGLKAAGGKKLSFGGALFAVLLPFVVFALISGALAGLQS
jgi:hypothetical protein